ncbi:Cytoplasmic dynein 2 light intermediate chain 1 [Toxocara canis]|uniref:Cytoplasmic dynein 2 light intermediate chain 1 n=1 Tax=Toxocara canis TaxID=6265 RepID=A0A0B2VDF4_TOXCA|nr:Cytoplasmic dynein 2 light intermediate chain 1 [Toxocara canis]
MVDIWTLAKERLNTSQRKLGVKTVDDSGEIGDESEFQRRHESYIIVCGSKNSGKSQMILRFLDRNENTKPTIALEYTYGRRTRGMIKDVAHIWELGGGTSLLNLMDIPLTSKNIEVTSLVIVIDLTKPEEMWNTFYGVLDAARARVESVMNELNDRAPNAYDRLIRNNKRRFGERKDASLIKQFPIPLAIVGAKYDEFQVKDDFRLKPPEDGLRGQLKIYRNEEQNLEPETRKNICKTLRFMALSNFASLQMFSNKMENLVIRARALISHLVFGTTASKAITTDFNKPLSIPAGADSFEDIGAPPLSDSTLIKMRAANPRDMWRDAFIELFPQTATKNELKDDPANDPQYREKEIDRLLEQKLQDLELYIKQKKDRQALEEKAERQLQQQAASMAAQKLDFRTHRLPNENSITLDSPRDQESA